CPGQDRGLTRNARPRGERSVATNGATLPAEIRELIAAKVADWLRRTCWHKQELEDLEQELATEYLRRSARLDPKKAVSGAYVSTMFDRILASIKRRRGAKKRNGRATHSLVDSDDAKRHDGTRGAPNRSDLEHAEMALDFAQVFGQLSPRRRKLALVLMSTKSKSEAARQRGVARSTQYDEILALRALFERAGLRGYL